MRSFTVITASFLCSLSWISVSGSESQTVDVQSGEDVTLLCSNFSSTFTLIIWFKLVDRKHPRCVSSMFKPFEPVKFCDGFQTGKFEMRSNISTLFLEIKQVDSSDSGLYFCGYHVGRDPAIVSATYLQVQEESDGTTKQMGVVLGGLTVVFVTIIICLAVQIKKLQKADNEEQNPQWRENLNSDDLKDADLSLYPTTIRSRRPESERQVETRVLYAACRKTQSGSERN